LYLNRSVYGQLAALLGGCALEFNWHVLRGAANDGGAAAAMLLLGG
jgi:hypothetical protein